MEKASRWRTTGISPFLQSRNKFCHTQTFIVLCCSLGYVLQEWEPYKSMSSTQMVCPDRFLSPLRRISPAQTKGHVQHSFSSVKLHWFWASGKICSDSNFTRRIKADIDRFPGYLINSRHHLILIKSQSVNSPCLGLTYVPYGSFSNWESCSTDQWQFSQVKYRVYNSMT